MSFFIDVSIFKRNRNYTLLCIGQFVSFFGTMITSVALPYQIYSETKSILMVGLLSLVQLVPIIFTALLGGVFADRYHRRRLLLASEAILAVGSLTLAMNTGVHASVWVLFVIAGLMAAFNGLHRPALDSIVQQIVERKDYPTVSAISSFKFSLGMIVGPALGGLLIAHTGLKVTYLVDFATFVISWVALVLMSHIPHPEKAGADEPILKSLTQGFKYALSRQELIGTYVVDFVAMVFGMPNALMPAIAESFGGVQALGMLYAAPAVGALVASMMSGWARKVTHHGQAVAYASGVWGVAIIAFGFAGHFYWALFFLAIAGGADGVSGIFRSIMWNESIPNHLRGRMAGIEMVSYLSGPKLGDTEASLVAAAFGVTASVVSGGVLCVVGVVVSCYYLPKFWRYHSPQS